MKLYDLTKFLDEYLSVDSIDDSALNGLQVEGGPDIKKIALATFVTF